MDANINYMKSDSSELYDNKHQNAKPQSMQGIGQSDEIIDGTNWACYIDWQFLILFLKCYFLCWISDVICYVINIETMSHLFNS